MSHHYSEEITPPRLFFDQFEVILGVCGPIFSRCSGRAAQESGVGKKPSSFVTPV